MLKYKYIKYKYQVVEEETRENTENLHAFFGSQLLLQISTQKLLKSKVNL